MKNSVAAPPCCDEEIRGTAGAEQAARRTRAERRAHVGAFAVLQQHQTDQRQPSITCTTQTMFPLSTPNPSNFLRRAADRHEIVRHQRSPADQAAIHVRHREQLRGIRRPSRCRRRGCASSPPLGHPVGDAPAYERMHRLRLLRSRGFARADRPNRFVGDHALPVPAHPPDQHRIQLRRRPLVR